MSDEVADAVKTLGKVAEYWLADPSRAIELQSSLGRAYLDLWGSAVKRLAGETARARRQARSARPALRRSGMVVEPVFRFRQAGLSALDAMGRRSRQECQGSRSAYAAQGRVLCAADRERGFAVEFRPDQSGIAARDALVQRGKSRARHGDAQGRHRRAGQRQYPAVRSEHVRGRAQSRDHARQGRVPE